MPALDRSPSPARPGASHIVALLEPRETPSRAEDGIKLALVGTYAPRKCGLATFTADVHAQLTGHHPEFAVSIYALDDSGSTVAYDGVDRLIAQDDPASYAAAAQQINASGADAVWVQHEFGIFGGPDGEMICDFVDRLAAPLIFTFHTVLSEPSDRQRRIVKHLLSRAMRVMVMSEHGRDILIQAYGAAPGAIQVIPHGAPDRPFGREAEFKQRFGLAGREVMMTFGLLGPGKGLEQAIEALPRIVAEHPRLVYRIVGVTHPNLVASEGEAYRGKLQALADRLGVADHILWEDRFLETDELLDQLETCDIYITPYPNLQQATSGTLSYAVALGKAVVSTPYVHARELLADGAGVLVEPNSSDALADAVIALLGDPAHLAATKERAYAKGRGTIWSAFAQASADLVRGAIAQRPAAINPAAVPGLSALFEMTDATGMLQHAIGIVPDRRHGYCIDDNARALILMNLAEGLSAEDRRARSVVFASFIQHAWNPEARRFRNFMRFDRTWCEDIGSEDSNGRTLWALGHTIAHSSDADLRRWAMRWFDEAAPALAEMGSPRAVAFTMLGAAALLRRVGSHGPAEAILDQGARLLQHLVDAARRPDWAWFEAVLGYDNPRLSQALIEAGDLRGRSEWVASGIETLNWIAARQTASAGHFIPVGSESFGRPYAQFPFDQQALEAQAAIEAAQSAFAATRNRRWLDHAHTAYAWFFGRNDRGLALADIATGRCRDGITPQGLNENSGAESILAFQLSYYALNGLRRASSQPSTAMTLAPQFNVIGQTRLN
ncbi:MAG: glycosyltransferase family 4 protein [Novosphingobium sp.]